MTKLSQAEIQKNLTALAGWTVAHDKLQREYTFPDFVYAFGFMATAAIAIEKMGHHPEWSNIYNSVAIDLTTHDAGGVTGKDFELASLLEAIAAKLQAK